MRLVACLVLLISSFAFAQADLITAGDELARCKVVLTGAARLGALGDPNRDSVTQGFTLDSASPGGEVTTRVDRLDSRQGRWFRFAVRGLPQSDFRVDEDDLYLKVAFFGADGRTSYDAKDRKIYNLIADARQHLAANGVHGRGGAEVWQTYALDFYLPFPQVHSVDLSVGFDHGSAPRSGNTAFLVDSLSLTRIPTPGDSPARPTTAPLANVTDKDLIAIGGRWFYLPLSGETAAPREFNSSNADRLMYRDDVFSAPFAGNTSAWLRSGDIDLAGKRVNADRLIENNLPIRFDAGSMILHTHNVPNHATGRFPEQGFGNPSRITEQDFTYYLPLKPTLNATATITTQDNSNHALHMGPIGIAVNGVVFFNPFDMGNTDATNLMDRCCGHPNPDGAYHYHKYPICVNSPWSDEGRSHSPLIGFAFDGLPLYGPYESSDVMAKDLTGSTALNGFNAHFDEQRGWHYHVTPGRFPYLIGGFLATEDSRNHQRPNHPGGNRAGNGRPPMNDRPNPNGPPVGNRSPPPPFED